MKFLTGAEEEVRRTLMKADLPFKEQRVLVVGIANRPGEWVKVARHLASAGLQVEASYLLSQDAEQMRFVFAVDNYEKARKVCSEIAACSAD